MFKLLEVRMRFLACCVFRFPQLDLLPFSYCVATVIAGPAPAPAKAPVAAPAPAAVTAPVAAPATAPVTALAVASAPAPMTAPVVAPAPTPVTASVVAPAPEPTTAPAVAPAPTPVTAPVVAPAPEPTTAPAVAPVPAPVTAATVGADPSAVAEVAPIEKSSVTAVTSTALQETAVGAGRLVSTQAKQGMFPGLAHFILQMLAVRFSFSAVCTCSDSFRNEHWN
jgi:hypothetical protein